MAIQKMEFIRIVGSLDDMHEVLEKLVLSEKLHFDFEGAEAYDSSFIIHEYESLMTDPSTYKQENLDELEAQCASMQQTLEYLCKGLSVQPDIDKECLADTQYNINDARNDLDKLMEQMNAKIEEINRKKGAIGKFKQFREIISGIAYKDIDFKDIAGLNYFDYEIGFLSKENRMRLRRNYENISAIALNIGTIRNSTEDIDIIIFPKQFREETAKLLRSLNWVKLDIPEDISGDVSQMIRQADERIRTLQNEMDELSKVLHDNREEIGILLNKIYATIKLEERVLRLERDIVYGQNTFVLNAWIRKGDRKEVERVLSQHLPKLIIEVKNPDELERQVTPPTQFKNGFFVRPFEKVIRLYGLPAYNEIDPTPFVAITFCLMFGIMFGDIGQGLVYLLAGILIVKRRPGIGRILTRLGGSSIVFGFIYGSLFGLEQEELPWLPSLTGRPLDPKNIPMILIAGVIFGAAALTVSFAFGIINAIRRGNIEEGIFGKNGLAGYIFLMGLIFSAVAVTGIIVLPVGIPLLAMLASLILMMAKAPLSNLILNNRPLIHGTVGSYLTESVFEAVETILSTLSNAISFIRVGAFALNHAGLFLAFLVMSGMTENIVLKIIILILGNILILTLEGLVVFIQGLRLQYYEMFGKYFQGGGVAFNPAKINN